MKYIVKVYNISYGKRVDGQSEEQENNLLPKIEEEDIRLNKDLCARRMAISHGIDKI